MRKLELGLTSLQLIAMGRGVRGGQALVPLYFGGRRCINRCTKSFRPCPISPTVADYCRRIRLIPLRPASELPTVTARPHGMKGRERVSEGAGKYQTSIVCGGVVQLVRTPACHAGGRGFESANSFWSGPETWVTLCTGYMGNTFGPKGFSSG